MRRIAGRIKGAANLGFERFAGPPLPSGEQPGGEQSSGESEGKDDAKVPAAITHIQVRDLKSAIKNLFS